MINGRCPICSRAYQIQSIDDLPHFPFCTHRCRLVDLGRWIDGKYAVPETSSPKQDPDDPGDSTDDEAGD